ncbi:spore germination protein [Paenibacillus sp. LHD-117]|uniref:spore germination protein n=1 Tax=Paenibacillus sp. LHD-117 TaxID=3071412 RepID=UPI0027DFC24F|nr:spore germination protein [Paenibacillus sp. LHD-117]MDQ6420634.1 spore germination protein [Paenibacillus sp. LHD-117]
MKVHADAERNGEWFREQLTSSSDLVLKKLTIEDYHYLMVYLEPMVDTDTINENVIKPLQENPSKPYTSVISMLDNKPTDTLEDALDAVVNGKSVIQKDGESYCLLLGTELNNDRAVNIPVNERVIRGAKQAFIESFETNIYMIRKYASSSKLAVTYHDLGGHSVTRVAIAYMKGICKQEVVEELTKRITAAEGIDATVTLGYIKGIVTGRSFSFMPPIMITERPDRVKAYLMEGKAVLIVEGSADALIVPISFWSFFQSPDDYNMNWIVGSAIRCIRLLAFLVTLALPGLYVAFTTFIPFMLPTEFALTLQSSQRYISMPPVMEVLFMMFVLEIVREAAIRLASPIAQTIGVVGGIVLGSAVVQSNIVSNTSIIVVALTGLATFVIPVYEMSASIRLYSVVVIFAAQLLGIVGMTLSILLFVIHICRMNTLGVPYFEATFPFLDQMKDTFFRTPGRKAGAGKK